MNTTKGGIQILSESPMTLDTFTVLVAVGVRRRRLFCRLGLSRLVIRRLLFVTFRRNRQTGISGCRASDGHGDKQEQQQQQQRR